MNQDWKTAFVGRKDDLEFLREQWQLAKSGKPRMLVLLAESGIGKTRLVQEFYRWLSREEDRATDEFPEGYWPDAFDNGYRNLDVNPTFNRTDQSTAPPIPWLWWGMRWSDPLDRHQVGGRCAIEDSREHLAIHSESILRARKLKNIGRDAVTKIMGLFPGIGEAMKVKDLYELGKSLRDARTLDRQNRTSPDLQFEQFHSDIVDIAIDTFRTILNPRKKEANTVPVLMVLDDAQWAESDPITLRFLQRLLTEANANQWPLLVVATHWEREWHLASQRGQQAKSPTADSRSGEQSSNETDSFHRLCQQLSETDVTVTHRDIALAPEVAELFQLAFPGMTTDQIDLLAAKAGGNFRLVEEIILDLEDRAYLFEEESSQNRLSDHGLQKVVDEKFDLERLVEKRFLKIDEHVRKVLGWSSIQGVRFLSEVTLQALSRSTGRDAADWDQDLRRGEFPHRWVTAIDGNEFKIGEYRQAVFHRVARQHVVDRSELNNVVNATERVVKSWLESEKYQSLPIAEQTDFLRIAESIYNPENNFESSNPQIWGFVVSRMIERATVNSLNELAFQHALRLASSDDAAWKDVSTENLFLNVVQRLIEWRRVDSALRVMKYVQQTRDLDSSASRIYHRIMGDLHHLTGQFADAKTEYRASLENARRIIFEFGETPESLRDLSSSLNSIGDLALMEGDLDAARLMYNVSLGVRQRIIGEFDQTPERLENLINSLAKVGDVELKAGDQDAAQQCYTQSLGICQLIIHKFGVTPDRVRNWGVLLEKVGDINLKAGDQDAARQHHTQSLEVRQAIIDDFGETPERLRDLSHSLDRVGDSELKASEHHAARERYAQSLDIRKRIIDEFGETPESLRDLTISLTRVGDLELNAGEHHAARERYSEMLAIHQRIIDQFGESPESLHDLSVSLSRQGTLELMRDEHHAARERYSEMLAIHQRIIDEYGETPQNLRGLMVSLFKFAELSLQLGERDKACDYLKECLEISTKIEENGWADRQTFEDRTIVQKLFDEQCGCDTTAEA